jgi:hypothetical protein
MTIEQLRVELAALPPASQVPNTLSAQSDYFEWKGNLNLALMYGPRVAEYTAEIATQTKAATDLREIEAELTAEMNTLPLYSGTILNPRDGYVVSLKGINGTFSFQNEAFPTDLPLFVTLRARGYVGPDHSPGTRWARSALSPVLRSALSDWKSSWPRRRRCSMALCGTRSRFKAEGLKTRARSLASCQATGRVACRYGPSPPPSPWLMGEIAPATSTTLLGAVWPQCPFRYGLYLPDGMPVPAAVAMPVVSSCRPHDGTSTPPPTTGR